MEDLVAEHLDHLHYLNDILLLNINDLNTVLSDNLLHRLIIPLYMNSFLSVLYRNLNQSPSQLNNNNEYSQTGFNTIDAQYLVRNASLSPLVALFLLTQAYIIFSYTPLLNTLVNTFLRSSKIDIELYVKRCEFNSPLESLTEALDHATKNNTSLQNDVSSMKNSAYSSSSDSSPLKVLPVASKEMNTVTTVQVNEAQPNELAKDSNDWNLNHTSLPNLSKGSFHPSQLHHELTTLETETFPIHVVTFKNWPEIPFLISILSCLNSSLPQSSENLFCEQSTSGLKSQSRNRSSSIDSKLATKTLKFSCHSPVVIKSLIDLSSPDDRIILFTLSLISSILTNKGRFV